MTNEDTYRNEPEDPSPIDQPTIVQAIKMGFDPWLRAVGKWWEDEGHRERSVRGVPKQGRTQIRIEQRQFLVGRLLGHINIGPEPVGRSILGHRPGGRWWIGRLAGHLLEATSSPVRFRSCVARQRYPGPRGGTDRHAP